MLRVLAIPIRNVAIALLAALETAWRALIPADPVEWVAYELDGQLGRGAPDERRSFAWKLPGSRISSIDELRHQLEFLREVPSVRGVLFRLKRVHCGLSVLLELRAVLRDLRASGKRVVFFSDAYDTRDYWLASVADEVWAAPRGRVDVVGFAAASSAAARPFGKLGLSFEVIRAGTFKSAGELFGSERVSDAQKLQLEELVGDLHAAFLADVAEGRGRAADEIAVALDEGPYSAHAAKEAGLVDALLYPDEVRAHLGSDAPGGPRRARVGPFAAVLATHAPPPDWRDPIDRRPTVAVLDVEGTITHGRSHAMPGLAATAGSDTLVAKLTKLRRDRSVKAVVLRIDSRGGSALASDLIWRAARLVAEKKPVVAYLDDVAASGGYYIAAAAQRILASPTCVTGSIGVFLLRPDASGVFEKAEIDRAVVLRGRHAGAYRPDLPLTDSAREALQRDVLATYDEFVSVVAEGRGLEDERVRELAEGRVYLGSRAKDLALVDALGTLDDAIDEARLAAGIVGAVRVRRLRSRQATWREVWRMWRSEGLAAFLPFASAPADRIQALYTGELPLR